MKKSLLTHQRVLLVLGVLVLIGCLLPARWAGAISSGPRHAMETLVTPVSHPARSLVLGFVQKPREEEQTIESLIAQRDEYHRLAYKLQLELDAQRERYEQIAQISGLFEGFTGLRFVSASVVAGATSFGQPTLRLNRGHREGLAVNQVVTHGIHLVGRVVDVGPMSATVNLITSPGTSLMVRFAPAGPSEPRQTRAIITAAADGRGFTGIIDANQPVAEGDVAFLADNQWPREGFIVGKVVSVTPAGDPLRRQVRVEPDLPLWSLATVTVLVPPVEP